MKNSREKGAIVVEATISFTAFIFTLLTILLIVHMAYAQARVGIALNAAAKEISQYSHLYFKSGIASKEQEWDSQVSDERGLVNETIDGLGMMIDTFHGMSDDAASGDFASMVEKAEGGAQAAGGIVSQYADRIAEDPKEFIYGMGQLALLEGMGEAKNVLGAEIARAFMKKNLKAYAEDDPDAFLKRYHIREGMDGLDFRYTSLFPGGSKTVQLVVTYKISAIRLLGMDLGFQIRQCAKTSGWDNGHSIIAAEASPAPSKGDKNTPSVWDTNQYGEKLIAIEKQKYPYVDSDRGFDAYDEKSNTFVHITCKNTFKDSYPTSAKLKYALKTEYSNVWNMVDDLDENIAITAQNGRAATVHSPKDTRKIEIVLVVPENADKKLVDGAVDLFMKDFEGDTKTFPPSIRVVYGYGEYNTDANSAGEKGGAS